ncbi:MAG TPA: lysophospholipid acyltransferase family protein [Mesorhizobium sp.]
MIVRIRIFFALAFIVASTLVLAPLQVLAMKTGLWRETVILKLWHRALLKGFGIRVHTLGALSEKRPLLVASNHISWTDILVLGAVVDVNFIAKSELEGWPLLGWLSKLQRTVFIERERKRKSGDQASEIATRLGKGDAMVLFAEGSTGDGNILLPFKSTLFGAASMAISEGAAKEVFIQPVAIAYTRLHGVAFGRHDRGISAWIGDEDLLPHMWALLGSRALDVEVHFGEPVVFSQGSNRKETARLVERRVQGMMETALRDPRPSRPAK